MLLYNFEIPSHVTVLAPDAPDIMVKNVAVAILVLVTTALEVSEPNPVEENFTLRYIYVFNYYLYTSSPLIVNFFTHCRVYRSS